jgi:hypothetical protein
LKNLEQFHYTPTHSHSGDGAKSTSIFFQPLFEDQREPTLVLEINDQGDYGEWLLSAFEFDGDREDGYMGELDSYDHLERLLRSPSKLWKWVGDGSQLGEVPGPTEADAEYIYGGDDHIEDEGGKTTGWSSWKGYPEGWLRIEDSNTFLGGNQIVYPFPLTEAQMADNDLLFLLTENNFTDYLERIEGKLEDDTLWNKGQWLHGYERGGGYRDDAIDGLSDALSELNLAAVNTSALAEVLSMRLQALSPYPSRALLEEFSSGEYSDSEDDNATVLYDVMHYIREGDGPPKIEKRFGGWDAEYAGASNYLTEREDLDPKAGPPVTSQDTPLEVGLKILDDPQLVGRGYTVEYLPAIGETPDDPGGVLISYAPGRAPDLIYDAAAKQWTVGDGYNYLRRFPGRFQQISFWEQEAGF